VKLHTEHIVIQFQAVILPMRVSSR